MSAVTATATETKELQCPSCQATVPVNSGFLTWCECGWNLKPQEPDASKRSKFGQLYEKTYEKAGARFGQSLFHSVSKNGAGQMKKSLATIVALAISALIHGLTLIVIALGLYLLVSGWPHPYAFVFSLLCFGVAYLLFPRPSKRPEKIISREKFPTLYQFVDEVSDAVGAKRVKGIVLTTDFNAAYGQVGWKQERVMWIGLPLFAILNGQEKVALVGHESAHGANGDPNRGFFIGHAIDSLIHWYVLLRPARILGTDRFALMMIVPNIGLLLFTELLYYLLFLLVHLSFQDSQRAEYYADALATTASGQAGLAGLFDKLHMGTLFHHTIQKAYHNKQLAFHTEFRRLTAELPPRELERIRRVKRLHGSRLDATHPPTPYRVDFIQAHGRVEAGYVLSAELEARLEQELAQVYQEVDQKVVEEYRQSLYG